jgi:hypothetical protein
MMTAAMRYYWGIFSGYPKKQLQLRIYGAFVAGTQIQYCVLVPIKHNFKGEPTFLFQTHQHWRLDLSGQTPISECLQNGKGDSCPHGICMNQCPNGTLIFCSANAIYNT